VSDRVTNGDRFEDSITKMQDMLLIIHWKNRKKNWLITLIPIPIQVEFEFKVLGKTPLIEIDQWILCS
jgi:hypothetical protein